jgi:hypothetical protein
MLLLKLSEERKKRVCLTSWVLAAARSILVLWRFSSSMACIAFSFVSNKTCTKWIWILNHVLYVVKAIKYSKGYTHNKRASMQYIPTFNESASVEDSWTLEPCILISTCFSSSLTRNSASDSAYINISYKSLRRGSNQNHIFRLQLEHAECQQWSNKLIRHKNTNIALLTWQYKLGLTIKSYAG